MTDIEKLIKIIEKLLVESCPIEDDLNIAEFIADYLLANGIIVPLCDIGQTVYDRYGYSFKIQRIEVLEDKKILFRCGNDSTDDYMAFYDFEVGTDVFLTKEEAEKALAERASYESI